ncbi:L-rhamnose mutarotase [Streptomyces iranensis]|uniref:L-rhamnose mutarotase n=1 Tax=Streptomyces iranensis TaxID=576784 RepID=A0A060ZNF4_9ACTN|nr:L-rhamnose mutarotase [Streptomyces iranensis]MBP2066031.1 L-rhamnose mutarotase [Streptomyces iranensis]CDR04936.1 predicted protein [Streptomyces iranensis]
MRRVCFLLKVRQDRIEEYRERHAAVWPEMRAALSETPLFEALDGTKPDEAMKPLTEVFHLT